MSRRRSVACRLGVVGGRGVPLTSALLGVPGVPGTTNRVDGRSW